MERPFDARALERALKKLPIEGQLAFLLSCAERLLPNYLSFQRRHSWGNATVLRAALDLGWHRLQGRTVTTDEINLSLERCEAATPDTEDFDSELVSSALDAANAAALVLEFLLESNVGKVVQCAELARDTVDMYVQELEDLDPNDAMLETTILNHPLMQQELQRQRTDLETLRNTEWQQVPANLAHSWRNPSMSNIGMPAGE